MYCDLSGNLGVRITQVNEYIMKVNHVQFVMLHLQMYILLPNCIFSNGDFFSAKKMSPCYKVHKKKLLTSPVIM